MKKVTVFIPCYNAQGYIIECIESILNQSYQDFEILIVDDGSTDQSVACIQALGDDRIKVVQNKVNIGISKTLNKGFELTKTPYLVRQDADDVSHPQRLKELVGFMEANPSVDICGSAYSTLPNLKTVIHPEYHADIVANLFKYTCITHGTAIFRNTRILELNVRYESNFDCSEDYRFFTRNVNSLTYHNLKNVLYYYRSHDLQISQDKKEVQQIQHNRGLKLYLEQMLGLTLDFAPEALNNFLRPNTKLILSDDVRKLILLYKLINKKIRPKIGASIQKLLMLNLKLIVAHSNLGPLIKFRLILLYVMIKAFK